jgi:hypothetical protein
LLEKLTSGLHSATSSNIKELFEEILGIRDVSASWAFQKLSARECVEKLDDLVDLRHDIAHGANKRSGELSEKILGHKLNILTQIQGRFFNQSSTLQQNYRNHKL